VPVPRASTDRFGDRVGDCLRHRPGHPEALPGWLRAQRVAARALVAGTGSGVGQSTRMAQEAGHDGLRRMKRTAGAPAPADAALAGQGEPDYDARVFIGTLD
jgi:hypothetical protein